MAVLHHDTNKEETQDDNNKEEQGNDEEDDGFVMTQDNNTKDDETLVGETPKVQQASGRKAHQQTHKEAHHLAYRGGGTLGMSSDGNDEKTRGSKVRPGSRPVDKDRKAFPPQSREGLHRSEREGKKPHHRRQAEDPDDRANQRPYGSHRKAGAPKAPAKGDTVLRLRASMRMTRTTTRSQAWAPRNRCCSKPWRLLPSGAKWAQVAEMVAWGCARTMTSRQQPNLPLELRAACLMTKRGPHLRASRAPML